MIATRRAGSSGEALPLNVVDGLTAEPTRPGRVAEIGGSQYRVHPAAAVFPVMSGREFDELVEDVRVNGPA